MRNEVKMTPDKKEETSLRAVFALFVCLLLTSGFSAGHFASAAESKVPLPVKLIIMERCVSCHSGVSSDHVKEHPEAGYQCGSCHVPFDARSEYHEDEGLENCTECHESPNVTHLFLRETGNQQDFAPDAGEKCIECHMKATVTIGKGFPALNTDQRILQTTRKGTLRAWIQPGGFMEKYLTASQRKTVIKWIDQLSADRELGYDPFLNAVKVTTPPTLDGKDADQAWKLAQPHVISLTPALPYTTSDRVVLKAVYDETHLYILATWPDSTLSMTRTSSWKWTRSEWIHPHAAGTNDQPSEDRISFLWNMTIKNFRTVYGCAIKCHGNIPGSSEFTDLPGEQADIWHAKAGRGLGTIRSSQTGGLTVNTQDDSFEVTGGEVNLSGWCDDKYLVWYLDLKDGFDLEDSGRRGDSGKSVYRHNCNRADRAPLYMEKAPEDYIDAMVLTRTEIDSGETIVPDPESPLYAGENAVTAAWKNYEKVKGVIPERILEAPEGSRGDVLQSATWKDGIWISEFRRALDTGNPWDDVIFDDLTKAYEFSIAVFDNCGRGEIPPGHTTYGDGQYQILKFLP